MDYSRKARFIGNASSNILLFAHNAKAFAVLMQRPKSLHINRNFLSFLLSTID